MIKLSRTGITTLKRMYKSVLLKCLLINAGILLAAGSAMAAGNAITDLGSFDTSSGYASPTKAEFLQASDIDGMLTSSNYATTLDSVYQTKESGKGLSSNDFTNDYKNAIDNLGTNYVAKTTYESAMSSVSANIAANIQVDNKQTSALNTIAGIISGGTFDDTNGYQAGTTGLIATVADHTTSIGNLETSVAGKQDALTADEQGGLGMSVDGGNTYIWIRDNAITSNRLAGDAVNSAKIADGTIVEDDLAAAVSNNLLNKATTSKGLTITDGDDTTAANIALRLDTDKGLIENDGGLAVKVYDAGGLKTDANGLQIVTKADGGITVDNTSGLKILTNSTGGLAVDASGLKVATKTAGGLASDASGLAVVVKENGGLAVDASGLQVAEGGIKTAMIDNKAVTLNKLADDVSTTTATSESAKLMTSGGIFTMTNVAAGNYIAAGTDVAGNLGALDTAIGSMADFGSQKYANSTTSVAANLTKLDTALKSTNEILGAAEDDTPSSTSLLTNQIGKGANTVVASLRTVADKAAGKELDNTFTGTNTFKENTTFEKGVTIGTAGVISEITTDFTGIGGTTDTGVKVTRMSGVGAVLSDHSFASIDGFSVVTGDTGGYQEVASFDANGIKITDGTDVKFSADKDGYITSAAVTTTASTVALGGTGYTTTVTGITKLDATATTGGLQFGDAGQNVNAIDATGLARAADGAATTLATTSSVKATIAAQAEDAVYTNSITEGSNITDATLNLALANLDTEIGADSAYASTYNGVAGTATVKANINAINAKLGNVADVTVNGYAAPEAPDPDTRTLTGAVSKLNTNMQTVLGAMYKDDGSYTKFAATNGFKDGANLTAQLSDYAANVRTATGGTFDEEGVWTATVSAASANKYEYTASANLMNAISQVAGNVGLADQLKATDKEGTDKDGVNGVTKDKTVNQNLTALNNTIGDLEGLNEFDDANSQGNAMTNGTGTAPTTVVEALNNIDLTLGSIHGLANKLGADYKGNLAEGTTVEQHLTALDAAIGDRSQFATGRYTATSESVADATMALDRGLGDLADEVRDFKKEYKSGMAQMAAMSALVPNARAHGNTQISVGTGAYQGQTAAAVGAFHWVNDNLLLNAGVSYGNSNNVAYRAGLTWSW